MVFLAYMVMLSRLSSKLSSPLLSMRCATHQGTCAVQMLVHPLFARHMCLYSVLMTLSSQSLLHHSHQWTPLHREWDARAKTIKDTQPRLIVSLKGHPPMLFLQPLSGEENGVIQIYTTLFGCLPDSHFTGDLAPLKSWWPMLLSSSGAAVS